MISLAHHLFRYRTLKQSSGLFAGHSACSMSKPACHVANKDLAPARTDRTAPLRMQAVSYEAVSYEEGLIVSPLFSSTD